MTSSNPASQTDQSDVDLTVHRTGSGRPVMVIHGGGGPMSVNPLVDHLQDSYEVLAPTIPGFGGTPRPDWFDSIDDVAYSLVNYLRDQNLSDVAVVGSSIGGWVAAAMAIFDGEGGRISQLVSVDGLGVEIPGQPIRDFFSLSAREVADYSFHDGDKYFVDPAMMSDDAKAAQAKNLATLRVYAGDPYMYDPHLIHRLDRITIPVAGIWGDSDRIGTPEYGAAYLGTFPNSEFHLVEDAGHLPHIEQPAATFALLDPFLARS